MTTSTTTAPGVVLPGDVHEMFSHYVLYGLAALCEQVGVPDVRISWSRGMSPRATITGGGLDAARLGVVVLEHAQRYAQSSWLHETLPHDSKRALMSPRVTAVGEDRDAWQRLMKARWEVEEQLEGQPDGLSLALIGALGQPSSWHYNRQGQRMQDDGASRLEMQPRNQGSEFVGTKLRALASAVAARSAGAVTDGLLGRAVLDDIGKGAADSRTATNLRPLGPTDSAAAWVALWGISQVPLVHRVRERSATATHVAGPREARYGTFVLPTWEAPWRPAKLRALLASRRLQGVAELVVNNTPSDIETSLALGELRGSTGVAALVAFPVARYGSDSAPERRALRGRISPT